MSLHSTGISLHFKLPMSESELTGKIANDDALKTSSLHSVSSPVTHYKIFPGAIPLTT